MVVKRPREICNQCRLRRRTVNKGNLETNPLKEEEEEEEVAGPWRRHLGTVALGQIAFFDTQTDFLLTQAVICGQLVVALQPPGLQMDTLQASLAGVSAAGAVGV